MKTKGIMSKYGMIMLPKLDDDSLAKLQDLIRDLGNSVYDQGFNDGFNAESLGCNGCAFEDVEEWEMPCAKCSRACKDYWRAKA